MLDGSGSGRQASWRRKLEAAPSGWLHPARNASRNDDSDAPELEEHNTPDHSEEAAARYRTFQASSPRHPARIIFDARQDRTRGISSSLFIQSPVSCIEPAVAIALAASGPEASKYCGVEEEDGGGA